MQQQDRSPKPDSSDVERGPGPVKAPDPAPSSDPRNVPERQRDPLKQPGDTPDIKPDVIADDEPARAGGQRRTP